MRKFIWNRIQVIEFIIAIRDPTVNKGSESYLNTYFQTNFQTCFLIYFTYYFIFVCDLRI